MKSQRRTDFAITWWECKKSLASKTLTSFQTLTSCQMNSETSMLTTRSWSNMTPRRIFGLWSQQTHLKERVSTLLMISMMWMWMKLVLLVDMSLIHCLLTAISLTWESMCLSLVMSLWECMSFKRDLLDLLVKHILQRSIRTISICISLTIQSTRRTKTSYKMKTKNKTTSVSNGV